MAALSTLAAIAIGGLVGGIASGAGKKAPKAPALPAVPAPPDPAIAQSLESQAVAQRRKRQPAAGTLLTGPSGLADSAPVMRKTLLGL